MSFVLLMIFVSPFYAHSTSQKGILAKTYNSSCGRYCIGGEDVGWSVDELHHTNGTGTSYSFSTTDTELTGLHKQIVIEGANKWSGIVTITNKTDGTGVGKIETVYNANSGILAECTSYKTGTNGHLTGWRIILNRAYSVTSTDVAHEFGHAIGLNDLYQSKNKNKLMYGYSDTRTASRPTSSDVSGAMIITGVHTSHTWGYKFYDITNTGNRHINYCTYCNGIGLNVSKCIYGSNNKCLQCGTSQSGAPQ